MEYMVHINSGAKLILHPNVSKWKWHYKFKVIIFPYYPNMHPLAFDCLKSWKFLLKNKIFIKHIFIENKYLVNLQ